jgi:hypothetical protein
MAYTINLSNGTEIVAGGLSDGSVDTSATSLTLIGKNYAGYGEILNENLVHLLENFAQPNSGANPGPPNPLAGQLWWDTTNNILRVYSGTSWKISTGATSAPFSSPPGDLSALGGDLWFDSTNQQLKIYSGSAWITVGPVATPTTGDTGAFPSVMTDTLGGSHIVTQIRIAGVPFVIISKDTFPSALAGFATVKAGINFSTIASPVMGINTQDTNAIASTLVQRDSSAGITGAAITGTILTGTNYITSPTVIATTSFTGNLAGNVTADIVSATTVSASGVSASGGFTGTILTASQPQVTALGTLIGLSINGNVAITAASATLNGSPIARIGDPANFSSINNTPIGNAVPSTGAFTSLAASGLTTTAALTSNGTIIASTVQAGTLGNTGALLTGTLTTASQPNVTTASSLVSVGNITTGTWSATTVQPQYGGTGVNNGVRTITLGGSLTTTAAWTLNQNVEINSSPTLRGTNFNSIPNGALINSGIVINGTSVSLGGTYSQTLVSSITGATDQITANVSTGNVGLSLPQSIGTTSNVRFGSLGIGTAASGTTGEIRATNNITAYYSSDKKFKENIRPIPDALNTVSAIGGDLFDWTDEYCEAKGGVDGYFVQKSDFGVIAQKVKAVFPIATRTRPDGSLAVDYEKLCALAFAAIDELRAEVEALKAKIN